MESGLNKVGNADFTWRNCGRPVTFPDGTIADAYLRRGGISDYLTATIQPGDVVTASLHGYTLTLSRFRLAFFDNEVFDENTAGDMDIQPPADITLPLINFRFYSGCVQSAHVRQGSEPVLGLWRIQTHPTAIEFRPEASSKSPDGKALWVLGRIEIPHLALPPDDGSPPDYESGLPLDLSLAPTGTIYTFEWKEESGRYLFDGFDFLVEEIRPSDSGPPIEQPGWVVSATLGQPPCEKDKCDQGFIALTGHLLTPLYGELENREGSRPELLVMAGSDYVGFTERAHVQRGWTDKVGFGFEFDLIYTHDADGHAGRFLGWDQEEFVKAADFLKVFSLDWATIISPTETGIYFGLSTVPAVLRTLAETTLATVPPTFTHKLSQTAQNEWFPALGLTPTLNLTETRGYLDFTSRLWVSVTNPSKTTEEIDKLKDGNIPTVPKGGGAIPGGKLDEWGIHFDKIRGQAVISPVYSGNELVDWHLEELRISLQMNIEWEKDESSDLREPDSVALSYSTRNGNDDGEDKFIRAKRITFQITRDGDYALVGDRVRTNLGEYLDRDIGFALLLNITTHPRLEGGILLYDLDLEGIKFQRVSGVFGVGDEFFYLGVLGDGTFRDNPVGGAFLFGTIYADSIVLREMGFDDLLTRLEDTSGENLLVGGYLRVYGDFVLYDAGCSFNIRVGGEVEAWYFADDHGDDTWGGRIRGYVFGDLMCVISGRGDLAMEIFRPDDPKGTKPYAFRGEFWIAGGVGSCDPEDWDSWESRWWGDSWCYTCGAIAQVDYNQTVADDWEWDYEDECE
jgi:hypothetical protein